MIPCIELTTFGYRTEKSLLKYCLHARSPAPEATGANPRARTLRLRPRPSALLSGAPPSARPTGSSSGGQAAVGRADGGSSGLSSAASPAPFHSGSGSSGGGAVSLGSAALAERRPRSSVPGAAAAGARPRWSAGRCATGGRAPATCYLGEGSHGVVCPSAGRGWGSGEGMRGGFPSRSQKSSPNGSGVATLPLPQAAQEPFKAPAPRGTRRSRLAEPDQRPWAGPAPTERSRPAGAHARSPRRTAFASTPARPPSPTLAPSCFRAGLLAQRDSKNCGWQGAV
ncbi:uncharacterized protein [Vicugna pacos]|uniref:Uncharacterized protein isoform X1 n=1 Tax=Vicugna pacos TaxID=30538 RepID=A0ABM5C8N9_VICPA